jgi:hypothetical protein
MINCRTTAQDADVMPELKSRGLTQNDSIRVSSSDSRNDSIRRIGEGR